MSDKKHIDRLFQERFKDFEANPDPSVWSNIQSSLNADKKRRRVIPIWWKIAGVAALLMLSFTIGNFIYNSNSNSDNPKEILVDSENSTPKDLELDSTNSNNSSNKNNTVTSSTDDLKSLNQINTNSSNNSNEAINQNPKNVIKNNSQLLTKSNLNKNNITSSSNKNENKGQVIKKNLNTISKSNTNAVAIIKNQQLENNNNSSNNIDEKANSDLIKNTISKTTGVVTQTESLKEENKLNQLKTLDEVEETTKEKEEGTLSIEEELAETNNEKEEEIIEKEELKNRWNVMPNIAPVYFNTLGKGSSIDSQFANNDKSGTLNMSYGIAASYAINNRLAVRTGINRVNVGYDTNNVLIYQGVETSPNNSRPIKSINYNENAQNTVVISADNFAFAQVPGVLSNAIDASLDQRLGFIEVPLELSYKVSDKKLGINVIGGVSALFLNENEVYSTLNGNSRLLGEANNINETSFSANFGLGLDYKLSDKFDINLEPLFKYQMNTFKDTSGDFKPFIIGVYTGFSFKF